MNTVFNPFSEPDLILVPHNMHCGTNQWFLHFLNLCVKRRQKKEIAE